MEDKVGNRAIAVQFQQSALRYIYQAGWPETCASCHNNLANYLRRNGEGANIVLAHTLAAGIIWLQTGSGGLSVLTNNLANSPMPATPPTFDEVVATVEQTEGVRFRTLFARLPKRAPNGDAAMAAVWQMAKKRRAEREQERAQFKQFKKAFDGWPPAIIAAIESGDEKQMQAALGQLSPKELQQMKPLAKLMGYRENTDE